MKSPIISISIVLVVAMYMGVEAAKLAIQPTCGHLNTNTFCNFNSGINLSKIKTIYGFGDSFTSNGQRVGGAPPAAVRDTRDPNNPRYGQRASNGLVWIEQFSEKLRAVIKDYAIGGSTISAALWPSNPPRSDMITHVKTYLSQNLKIDGESTMAMISYGINDWAQTRTFGTQNLPKAADELLRQTEKIINSGIRNIVVLSPPMNSLPLKQFNDKIWDGLKALRERHEGLQIGYVDQVQLFTAMLKNPASFGFKSTSSCLKTSTSLAGSCSNPDDYMYYIPGHPSVLTHGLMAEWAQKALTECR